MRRFSVVAAALGLILCASTSFAIFPGQKYGLQYPAALGDGYVTVKMQQGWWNLGPAWYICTDTNDISFARWYNLTLSPKLSSAIPAATRRVFIVTNPSATQLWLFDSAPGEAAYTPLWRVIYATWNPGATKRPLSHWSQVTDLAFEGKITLTTTNIVVNCPILALYRLGGPFLEKPFPFYRIPQGRVIEGIGNTKYIQLPYWNVYCQNPVTRAISVSRVIITDASTFELAQLLGANRSSGLSLVPNSDRSIFHAVNWAQDFDPSLPGIQPLKVLANQYPVICDCPTGCGFANTNYGYSPLTSFVLLNRLFPTPPGYPTPAETLVNNCALLRQQMLNGNLQSVRLPTPPLPAAPTPVAYPQEHSENFPFVLNSPVLCNGRLVTR